MFSISKQQNQLYYFAHASQYGFSNKTKPIEDFFPLTNKTKTSGEFSRSLNKKPDRDFALPGQIHFSISENQ
jgi:hypothetical protein